MAESELSRFGTTATNCGVSIEIGLSICEYFDLYGCQSERSALPLYPRAVAVELQCDQKIIFSLLVHYLFSYFHAHLSKILIENNQFIKGITSAFVREAYFGADTSPLKSNCLQYIRCLSFNLPFFSPAKSPTNYPTSVTRFEDDRYLGNLI